MTDDDLGVGTTLRGRFRLEEKLKDGLGISTWRSWDLTAQQSAVLKVAPLSEISAPELLEHEAQVLSRLGCLTLGTLLSAGREDRFFYLAYRFVRGESLEQQLFRGPTERRADHGPGRRFILRPGNRSFGRYPASGRKAGQHHP